MKSNHALWIGPLITLAGAVSYFTVFSRFAPLRDFPWLNLPVVLAGLALSALAFWRAIARRSVYRGTILGSRCCRIPTCASSTRSACATRVAIR